MWHLRDWPGGDKCLNCWVGLHPDLSTLLPHFGLPGAPRTSPTRTHKSPRPGWQQVASQSGLRFDSPTAQPSRRGGGWVAHWDGRRVLPCRVSEGQAWVKNPWVYTQV